MLNKLDRYKTTFEDQVCAQRAALLLQANPFSPPSPSFLVYLFWRGLVFKRLLSSGIAEPASSGTLLPHGYSAAGVPALWVVAPHPPNTPVPCVGLSD